MQNGLFEIGILSDVLLAEGKVRVERSEDESIRVGHEYVVDRAKMQGVEQKGDADHFEAGMDPAHNERYTDPMHLTHRSLQVQDRNAHHNHTDEIRHQEHSSAIFVDEIGEPPERSETYCNANDAQDVLPDVVVDVRVALVVS